MAFPRLEVIGSLSDLVKSKYDSAKASNALVFSSTQLAIVHINKIPFQLRYCPALSGKPTGQDSGIEHSVKRKDPGKPQKPDPFENPPRDLLIAEVSGCRPTHNLILNKYPVIPQHFILATKEYRRQTDLLDMDDLSMMYACLRESEKSDPMMRLFAFFNSGPHSGASQGHRHVQFLPIEEMHGNDDERAWKPLIDMVEGSNVKANEEPASLLPFAFESMPILGTPTPAGLLKMYLKMYNEARLLVHRLDPEFIPPLEDTFHYENGDERARISYNLAMTTERMMICPRRSEGAMIANQIGPVAFNGTLLAGTLMVKTEEEWDSLRGADGPTRLEGMLSAVGYLQQQN